MFAAILFQLYKLYHISGTGGAVAAEAAKRVGLRIDLQGGRFIRMERAKQLVLSAAARNVVILH